MKFQLEGDPSEIASFLQTIPTAGGEPVEEVSSFKMISSFEREASRISSDDDYSRGKRAGLLSAAAITRAMFGSHTLEPAPDSAPDSAPVPEISAQETPPSDSATPAPTATVEPDFPNKQVAIKDRITQFLERRGKAKIGDIAQAIGLPSTKISPRIAELANDGFVVRFRDGDTNSYEFVRPWVSGKSSKSPVEDKAPEPVAEQPETKQPETKQPETKQPETKQTPPEKGGSIKEAIVNFLVGYGEASSREIAEYYDLKDQAIRSRVSELVREETVERIENKGKVTFRALKDWNGNKVSEPVAAKPASETKAKVKSPSQKTLLTDYLSQHGPTESSDLASVLPDTPRKTMQARLAELANDGFVARHYDDQKRIAKWELVKPYEPHQTVWTPPIDEQDIVAVADPQELSQEHLEQLRIMGVLADYPNSSYVDLETRTGLERSVLSKHLLGLEESGLVAREGQNPITFVGRPPTRTNQNPPPINSLNEAVMAMVAEKPGQTSLQMAIRMMKSWSEVARRLRDLQKTSVECRVEEGHERYYPRA